MTRKVCSQTNVHVRHKQHLLNWAERVLHTPWDALISFVPADAFVRNARKGLEENMDDRGTRSFVGLEIGK